MTREGDDDTKSSEEVTDLKSRGCRVMWKRYLENNKPGLKNEHLKCMYTSRELLL